MVQAPMALNRPMVPQLFTNSVIKALLELSSSMVQAPLELTSSMD